MAANSRTEVSVPTIGESIKTALIGRWMKEIGQSVVAGEPLFSVDSDKASLDVPAPASGVLVAVLAQPGDEVAIGAVVAYLEAAASAVAPAIPASPAAVIPAAAEVPEPRNATPSAKGPQTGPAARQVAAEHGLDIQQVEGSGARGRVLSRDV